MSKQLIDAYAAHRASNPPLPKGSAPLVSSSMFKLGHNKKTSFAQRWDDAFSQEGFRHTSSTLKAASVVQNPSEMISLGTARPAPHYYPWQAIHIDARSMNQHYADVALTQPPVKVSCTKGEAGYDLGLALNYGFAAGSPQLLRFVTEHVHIIHQPPYQDWTCSLTCGTTSALDIIFRMLCNSGDSVLSETFTYPGTIEAVKGLNLHLVGIEMDGFGLLPNHLESILNQWDLSKGPKPRLLYTIPSGQNPTGTTQNKERRRAIYEVAEHHDLIIVEDDPYYFIQLEAPSPADQPTNSSSPCVSGSSPEEHISHYLERLQPSYLSLDRSGRVLRLDATSKILAPGLRCGWITGCSQLIAKFISYTEMSTIAPSGPSQILLYKLLDETWGHSGFINWLGHLSWQFRQRLQVLVRACESYLPIELCSWSLPSAGMFLWMKVDWRQHPAAKPDRSSDMESGVIMDVEDKIYASARSHGVLVSKGSWFMAEGSLIQDVFFRLTFAAADDNGSLETAIVRLGKALRQEFGLKE